MDELIVGSQKSIHLPLKGANKGVAIQPTNIFCLGKNFAAHARETGATPPKKPIVFSKSPSNLILPGEPIYLPRARTATRVDHEVELAVILGKGGFAIPAETAMDHVFGYSILNDVTARDVQGVAKAEGHPWYLAKNLRHSCPMGPVVVRRDDLPDQNNLHLELRVNGEVRQEGNTHDFLFPVPRVIEFISHWLPVQPGDVIAMGTPAGISPLKPGDQVEAEIDEIGVLANPVVKVPRKRK